MVWEFMTAPENHPVWDSSQLGTTQLTDGPVAVGTRWKGTTRILGKKFGWTTEFTEVAEQQSSVSTTVENTKPAFTMGVTSAEVSGGPG